jgi:hypothetical protein
LFVNNNAARLRGHEGQGKVASLALACTQTQPIKSARRMTREREERERKKGSMKNNTISRTQTTICEPKSDIKPDKWSGKSVSCFGVGKDPRDGKFYPTKQSKAKTKDVIQTNSCRPVQEGR